MNNIKLSLICPLYKVVPYLPDLLNSLIVGLNSSEVEVVFVDDGCPENSLDFCKNYLAKTERYKFKCLFLDSKKNQGQAAARNKALKLAKGDYIGFIDSDDVISHNYWLYVSSFIKDGNVDIVEFSYKEFFEKIPVIKISDRCLMVRKNNLQPFESGFFVWTRIFRRRLIENITFPEGVIYEDIYFTISSFSLAKCIHFYDIPLVFYRKREGSTTSKRTSSYIYLLRNMISAISEYTDCYQDKKTLFTLLSRRALLVALKGLKIKDRKDRALFYKECLFEVNRLQKLIAKYTIKYSTWLTLLSTKFTCALGAKLP